LKKIGAGLWNRKVSRGDELNMFIRVALICGMGLRVMTAQGPLIDYVTYLGGAYTDTAAGIAVDSTGSVYVAGTTSSPDFPVTSTKLGTPSASTGCTFVTKFNPFGTGIEFSVCLANSVATAFALDARGNIYVATGYLSNTVVKLDPSAENILYMTPIGAPVESMAVDAAGDIYVAGAAGPGLATTSGAYQRQYAGGQCPGNAIATSPCNNAFITKLTPTGSVAWTTYLGGSGPDDAHAVAVDSTGSVWVAGETVSPNFPTTAGAISRTFHGEEDVGPQRFGDAFVAKFDPTGSHLLYSTYLGGSGADGALGLAVDAIDAVYVAGGTQSPNFPTTPGAFETTNSASGSNQTPSLLGNGFVTKLDTSGNLVYSTLTGVMNGVPTPIAADNRGQAYVSAIAVASSTSTLPTCAAPPKPAVLVINPTGTALVATSPIPGAYLVLDGKGGLYSAGLTYTPVFFTTPHAFQTEYGGGDSDAFAAKVDFSQLAGPSLASVLNAASLFPGYASAFPTGAVAPGEIVTLFGNDFGPAKPSVSFSQYPAPVLFASNCQINAVVPLEVTPGLPSFVTVQSGGQTLGPLKLPVAVAAPGIFTTNQSGSGQAAIINQDSTANSPSNPAARGSIVSVYMTGAGALNPFIADGSLGPLMPPFPAPVAGVSATIGAIDAPILFAGQAPGLIAGATQMNIQVPQNAPVGAAIPVTVYVAGYASQFPQSVTMAVR
jgi:uncharacterized protein (TIGR03437 family)